jgi:dCMP deaminase
MKPAWLSDRYLIEIARAASARSSCSSRKVGALIAVEGRVLATGYNGTPSGWTNCDRGGCPRCADGGGPLERCLCCHAEENAIAQSARFGVRVAGGTIYTTLHPCTSCARLIVNAGLAAVVFDAPYGEDSTAALMLQKCGVELRFNGGR